jgi:mono/diheme cytochrome c family protein
MAHRRGGKGAAPTSDRTVWLIAAVITVVACALMVLWVIPALTGDAGDDPDQVVTRADAAFLYERHCGTCHGLEGQGNIGPQLADGTVLEAYPEVNDQIAVITDGRNDMPPFGDSLTDAEIRAIAEHTRRL